MGPFRFVPFMECNHGVISMWHKVTGNIILNGEEFAFNDHMGYIEKDWGTSFPKKYFWLQCNDFKTDKASIMISIAEIPFLGTRFTGCICSVYLKGREYRLATYHGVKLQKLTKTEVVIEQKDYLLVITMEPSTEHTLLAPDRGNMSRQIKETTLGTATFQFKVKDKLIFQETSSNVSYEWVE
jgi:tocopherol cyclase